MNEDDHLFIFVIDHGGANNDYIQHLIFGYGMKRLFMIMNFAQWLKPFTDKSVTVNASVRAVFLRRVHR